MMKKMKIEKKFLIILLSMMIFSLVSILTYFSEKKEMLKKDDISRLTSLYNKNNKDKNQDFKSLLKDLENTTTTTYVNDETNAFDLKNDKVIEKLLIDITTLINNNEYSSILKNYNKDYVEEFKLTEENIKDKFKFSTKVGAKITKIDRDKCTKDRVVVTVRLIDNSQAERIFDFTVFKDGTIADIPLYEEIELNKVTERDDITYNLKKKFVTRLGSIFMVQIDNHSEYLLDIQDIKGVTGTSFEYNHELINGNKYTYKITPEKSTELIIKIFNEEKPDDIVFTNKRYDGVIETYSIWNKS